MWLLTPARPMLLVGSPSAINGIFKPTRDMIKGLGLVAITTDGVNPTIPILGESEIVRRRALYNETHSKYEV